MPSTSVRGVRLVNDRGRDGAPPHHPAAPPSCDAASPQPDTPPVDRRLAVIRDDDPRQADSSPLSPATPVPTIAPERALHIADDLLRTALHLAAPPAHSPSPCAQGGVPSGPRARGVRVSKGVMGVRVSARVRHATRLSEITPQPLRWLWPGRLPAAKLTVLDGDPGLGKSTLLCEIAARISRGEPLPGGEPGAPRGVLLCSAEDDLHDTIRPRIDAAGGDPQRIVSLLAIPDGTATGRPVALPNDLLLLEGVIVSTDAALVIIDPLVAYLRQGGSGTGNGSLRHTLTALKETAARTGAAIVVVRHLNKSRTTNPLYRGHGGIGIIGAARSGLLLAPDPDDPERRVLAVTKGNLSRPAPSLLFRLETVPGSDVARVAWEGESAWTAIQVLQTQRANEGDQASSAIDEARAWLREALAAGPRQARELRQEATEHGIGRNALYAARKAEGITIAKHHTRHGQWVWSLAAALDGPQRELPSPPIAREVQHL